MRLDVSTQARNQGKTTAVFFGGRKVNVATELNVAAFEELLLEILRML
jgi:ribosomal protein L25 (general stress protein Ctc)